MVNLAEILRGNKETWDWILPHRLASRYARLCLRRFRTGLLREKGNQTHLGSQSHLRVPNSLLLLKTSVWREEAPWYSGSHGLKSATRWVELLGLVSWISKFLWLLKPWVITFPVINSAHLLWLINQPQIFLCQANSLERNARPKHFLLLRTKDGHDHGRASYLNTLAIGFG